MDNKNNNEASITPETKDAFFDALVERIRDTKVQVGTNVHSLKIFQPDDSDIPESAKGILETFDEPLGNAEPPPPEPDVKAVQPLLDFGISPDIAEKAVRIDERSKVPHFQTYKNERGTIWHIGDEPYSGGTRNLLKRPDKKDTPLQPKQITEKMWSVNLAIDSYMPDDAFASYLTFFRENLDMHSHKLALDNSLEKLKEQIDPIEDWDADAETMQQFIEKNPRHKPGFNEAKGHFETLGERVNLLKHPDIVLSMAIFHAAHGAYSNMLNDAFDRAKEKKIISDDEHDNASFTMNSISFRQFHNFLLFANIASLSMHELNKLSASEPSGVEPAKQAINNAWDTFLGQKALTRQYEDHHIPPTEENPKGGGAQTCPAHKHLRATHREGWIEDTYDFVKENLQDSKQMRQAQQAISDALDPNISNDPTFSR